MGEPTDTTTYAVIVNHEEQYSLWPADKEVPIEWKLEGKTGTRDECMEYIREVWTDMRPLSLRNQMRAAGQGLPNRFAASVCDDRPVSHTATGRSSRRRRTSGSEGLAARSFRGGRRRPVSGRWHRSAAPPSALATRRSSTWTTAPTSPRTMTRSSPRTWAGTSAASFSPWP
ncbi:MbtH family protein [Streptomyces griseus]|uniref:MbtH family protein n=1 Tax=Streptomyces griseus TaxID=1911 RepID=UPI0013BE2E93|nr:MbtH family NRPS accessory protein [Streptomyces griseus]